MALRKRKIALIGAGNIGGILAMIAAKKEVADVIMYDVTEGIPQGKALDLSHALPVWGSSVTITGTNDYSEISGADVCIITAGVPRKPGMSRDDLLNTNATIMNHVAKGIAQYAPKSFVIVVSNPLDAMVTLCQRLTGFSSNMVVGMAGVLDSARYRSFLAQEIGCSPASVSALVLGGHGDDMVPVRSQTTVNGIPVAKFIKPERLDEIEKRVRGAGGEVVALLKSGSAYFSPAAAVMEMVESYLGDQKRVLASAAMLSGEYGLTGIYLGVPVVIGANGVEKIIEIELDESEKKLLNESAERVKDLIGKL